MNTRDVAGKTFAARPQGKEPAAAEGKGPEEIIFDKAEQATTLEERKESLAEIEERIETLVEELPGLDEEKKDRVAAVTERLKSRHEELSRKVADDEKKLAKEKESG